MSQTACGIVNMPPVLTGTLLLFHENLPVCCVLAFVCNLNAPKQGGTVLERHDGVHLDGDSKPAQRC